VRQLSSPVYRRRTAQKQGEGERKTVNEGKRESATEKKGRRELVWRDNFAKR